jgi:hypothetical protein
MKFADDLIPLLKARSKTLTYRLGPRYANIKAGDVIRVSDTADHHQGYLTVISVDSVEFGGLPPAAEGHEAYRSLDERRAVFEEYYGRAVTDDEPVTIISFKYSDGV